MQERIAEVGFDIEATLGGAEIIQATEHAETWHLLRLQGLVALPLDEAKSPDEPLLVRSCEVVRAARTWPWYGEPYAVKDAERQGDWLIGPMRDTWHVCDQHNVLILWGRG